MFSYDVTQMAYEKLVTYFSYFVHFAEKKKQKKAFNSIQFDIRSHFIPSRFQL